MDEKFLLGSPLKIGAVSLIYWLFVMKYGQKWMNKRQPYDLKNTMLVYNALQVLSNLYLVYLAGKVLLRNANYADWSCMVRSDPITPDEINGFHLYFMLKVSDYMDTIFMVLRKRYRQITFLHVYHHILMVLGVYYVSRFTVGGQTVMLGFINAIVHVIMYAYYFAAALKPGLRNSVGWKKYITQMQLAQFMFLMIHFARPFFNSNCPLPRGLLIFCLVQNSVMVFLFSDFYYKAYCKPLMDARREKQIK